MQVSVATANFYFKPFEQALEIIAEAGFRAMELDLFWTRKQWAVAQHLRDVPIPRMIRRVERSGLRISSIHDGGGVLEDKESAAGFINPILDGCLNEMGYAPDCLVFHSPHIEGRPEMEWWEGISSRIVCSLEKYRKACSFITIENMPVFDGYFVPLVTPEALRSFVIQNDLAVTLDTTHYAQIGTDIVEAARVLGSSVKTIHLSDFRAGKSHVFIGEGELDLAGFFDVIDRRSLHAVTLESSFSTMAQPDQEMDSRQLIGRLTEARARLEHLIAV